MMELISYAKEVVVLATRLSYRRKPKLSGDKPTSFLVQQEPATYEGNRLTSRRRNVFIPLRVFLRHM
jgi:hypothetical protein